MAAYLDQLHQRARDNYWLGLFTVMTRVLLAIGFMPSGLTKLLGNRFTLLDLDTGTPFITGPMLLASIYLLCWDYDVLKNLMRPTPMPSSVD